MACVTTHSEIRGGVDLSLARRAGEIFGVESRLLAGHGASPQEKILAEQREGNKTWKAIQKLITDGNRLLNDILQQEPKEEVIKD